MAALAALVEQDVYFDPAGPVETIYALQAQMNDN